MKSLKRGKLLALVLVVALFSQGFLSDLRSQFFIDWADKLYESGDHAAAFEKYKSAADLDSGYAAMQLFWMYSYGEGTPRDIPQAQRMLKRALELNNPDAKVIKAKEMLKDKSLHTEAVYLLLDAAEMENVTAYLELALLYTHGVAVPKNPTKAQEYLRLAKAHGVNIQASTSIPKTQTNTKAITISIQENLKKLGFYHGNIDGITGPMTRKSIADFQKFYGYEVDTQISSKILDQTKKAIK
jgi:tetratricopeptide (TPR) repeat protein